LPLRTLETLELILLVELTCVGLNVEVATGPLDDEGRYTLLLKEVAEILLLVKESSSAVL